MVDEEISDSCAGEVETKPVEAGQPHPEEDKLTDRERQI